MFKRLIIIIIFIKKCLFLIIIIIKSFSYLGRSFGFKLRKTTENKSIFSFLL